jgi:predicted AAA+ superfamily ATPase
MEVSMRKVILIFLFCFSSMSFGDTFFPLPKLSKNCEIEVEDYETKVRKDVQDYIARLSLDNLRYLFQIRRIVINEGVYSAQEKIDERLTGALSNLMTKSDMSEQALDLIRSIKDELDTYPLAVDKTEGDALLEQFKVLGI